MLYLCCVLFCTVALLNIKDSDWGSINLKFEAPFLGRNVGVADDANF